MRYECDPRMADWVAQRIPACGRGFGDCRAFGVFRDEEVIAGVVFHNWSPEFGTIEMSAASESRRWLTRPILHKIFAYPFGFCQMVFAQHSTDNPARRIWQRLGADEHLIPRLHGPDTVAAIATLTKEAWTAGPYYQGGQNGQR